MDIGTPIISICYGRDHMVYPKHKFASLIILTIDTAVYRQ